jgi:hypothetical protein
MQENEDEEGEDNETEISIASMPKNQQKIVNNFDTTVWPRGTYLDEQCQKNTAETTWHKLLTISISI